MGQYSSKTEYFDRLKSWGDFASPMLAIVSVASFLLFMNYFSSRPDLDVQVTYVGRHYFGDSICAVFSRNGLQFPDAITQFQICSGDSIERYLDSTLRVPNLLKRAYPGGYDRTSVIKELHSALETPLREPQGGFTEYPGEIIDNSELFEKEIPLRFNACQDTFSLAMYMALAIWHREITVSLLLTNKGDADAKDITLRLQTPSLDSPEMMAVFSPRFVEVQNLNPMHLVQNDSAHAAISLPYLRQSESASFTVTTTMTNMSASNVFVDYDISRTLNSSLILTVTAICTAVFYLLPMLAGLTSKSLARLRRRQS